MRRTIMSLVLVLAGLVTAYSAVVTGDELNLDQIVAAQAEIRTLEATFVQTKHLSLFDEELVSKGTITIEKPDFYRWSYEEPEQSVFFVDGSRTGSFQPGTGIRDEVDLETRKGMAGIIESLTPILSGNLDGNTESDYEVSLESSANEQPTYIFRPRSEDLHTLFSHITIIFDRDTGLARELIIEDPGGDSTQIEFGAWKVNIPVDRAGLVE